MSVCEPVCVCIYVRNRYTIFVVLFLFAFCSQSFWNIFVTLISLYFFPEYLSNCIVKCLCFIDRRY